MGQVGNSREPNSDGVTERASDDLGHQLTTGAEPDLKGAFSDDGVDLTLIRWMLERTPIERLQAAQQLIDATWVLRNGREA
jgi:hypothetical protein